MAACGYWRRRGLETHPGQVVVAPGAAVLLLAVLAAAGGGPVLTPRPCEGWYGQQARLLDRAVHTVPVPAECGGVPDPVALRETVRRERDAAGGPGGDGAWGGARGGDGERAAGRARDAGWDRAADPNRAAGRERGGDRHPDRARGGDGAPAVLVLSVADDCTGTAVPPELLLEVTEVAGEEGLLIVSDETWRETAHVPHTTVVVSPAEMTHGEGECLGPGPRGNGDGGAPGRAGDGAVVLADLRATLLPQGPGAGIARFPEDGRGPALAASVRGVLAALHAGLDGPDDTAVADALTEPQPLRTRRTAAAQAHGTLLAGLHRAVTEAGALCRPPRVGRHVYADFEPVRPRLAEHGIKDAAGLEAYLVREFGPYAHGGHRLGDDPKSLRVRLSALLATGGTPPGPATAQEAPLALARVGTALAALTGSR